MSASRIAYPLVPVIASSFPRAQMKGKKARTGTKRITNKDSRSFAASPSSTATPPCSLAISEIPFLLYLFRKDTSSAKDTQSSTNKLVVLYASQLSAHELVQCGFTADQSIWRVSGSRIPLTFNEDSTQHIELKLAFVADTGVKFLDQLKCQIKVEDLMTAQPHCFQMTGPHEKLSVSLNRMGKSSFEVESLDFFFDAKLLEWALLQLCKKKKEKMSEL